MSSITACLNPMGVWCDSVCNQLEKTDAIPNLAGGRDKMTEETSVNGHDDENAHPHDHSPMDRDLRLDFGRLMGVAIWRSAMLPGLNA
ncbi:hypothetical protein M3I54_37140 [Paraburkholderia sp. CNPSo 3274]|uniref:hypothetical protein n=1 Tax=unclassified Paraburkholderia TaxID=2615204 RepID=UPI0020B79926|nr:MULTISPECIES: hypothetical protein [unclassified Paraburkholderia]MCP3712487.1 hypothetical protein [Paraburkholderia sp. CNPSo 3274]MCP3720847.1 hypothetical protein [Paraburkholderia sp. CNPSo 3281]